MGNKNEPVITLCKGWDGKHMSWVEQIELFEGNKTNFYFFRITPRLKDERVYSKEGINKELEKKGWACGMGDLTSKEGVTYREVLEAMLFVKAYRTVYEELTKDKSPFYIFDITAKQFFDKIYDSIVKLRRRKDDDLTKFLVSVDKEEVTLKQIGDFLLGQKEWKVVSMRTYIES